MTEPRIHCVYLRAGLTDPTMMPIRQFVLLDRSMRARMIVDGLVEFLDASGTKIPLEDALSEVREIGRERATVPAAVLLYREAAEDREDGRRRSTRTPFAREIRVRNGYQKASTAGVSVDVSTGGMLFRSRQRFARGARVVVGWSGPSGDTLRWATVRRVQRDEPGRESEYPVTVAVEFEDPIARAA